MSDPDRLPYPELGTEALVAPWAAAKDRQTLNQIKKEIRMIKKPSSTGMAEKSFPPIAGWRRLWVTPN